MSETPGFSNSTREPWEEGLVAAARKLRNLLRDVDSASQPLWTGPQLDAAIYRYTEIFLPMLAAHASVGNSNLETTAEVKLREIISLQQMCPLTKTGSFQRRTKKYTLPLSEPSTVKSPR